MTDPRAVLGVGPLATRREIRAAFHRLARRYHPDVNPTADALRRMQQITAAYQLLQRETALAAVTYTATGASSAAVDVDVWTTATWSRSRWEDCEACSYELTFGKHRGQTMFWVAKHDQQYLGWIARQFSDQQIDVIDYARVTLDHCRTGVHAT